MTESDIPNQRILLVDDDADALKILSTKLRHCGYEVTETDSGEAALGKLMEWDPALVITDLYMPGISGLDLLERIKSAMPLVDVVVCTGNEDMSSAVEAMKCGAFDYLVKPLDLRELEELVTKCFREQVLNREVAEAEHGVEEGGGPQSVVGRDPRMIQIYKTVGVLASNRATVLVRGDTGTGKEMIARAIHVNSEHASAPFIAVNCTALSDTLLESELFGHVKGAFTGAVGGRKGYFELAGAGTIFLDEIGDTSAEFQTKLLRVLQERQFYPVGGERPHTTEARVIAATHRPMEDLVRSGEFREDLYFRLKVVEITIPPLRERRGDIPLLANALLTKIRRETGQDVRQIAPDAIEMLEQYDWPGNVRELENVLMRAAIQARGSAIGVSHLTLGTDRPLTGAGPIQKLDEVISDHVSKALAASSGDREAAAEALGLSVKELEKHLEKG